MEPVSTAESSDELMLQTAIDWLQQGSKPALVTVVKTWGSSPRPVGSLMLMRADGVHAGSVSGGCVEEDLLARFVNGQLSDDYPVIIDYGVDRQQATRLGLPCGGRLELCVEQLDSAEPLRLLLQHCRDHRLTARRLCLHTGEASLHRAGPGDGFSYSADYVNKVFGPAWQLLLIGAGHLSFYVAQIARLLDYRVIVCDPREDYQRSWQLADTELVSIMPDEAVAACTSHQRSLVITLSHDPKLDDMALLDALASPACYVGALGSRASNEQRRQRLRQLGVSQAQLARLHAPVGLPIGSHTPAEIAVSIMAEVTAVRHQLETDARQAASAA
jgi:xanthine dehydrogenase accessory factor